MSRRKIIISIVIVLIAAAAIYSYNEYFRSNKDLRYVKAAVTVDAVALINEFAASESGADAKYRNKIIAVRGMVKSVDTTGDQFSIAMGDTNQLSSVRFSMDSNFVQQAATVKRGMTITVKGAITGFKKDDTGLLGDDVEFNRCVIEP